MKEFFFSVVVFGFGWGRGRPVLSFCLSFFFFLIEAAHYKSDL